MRARLPVAAVVVFCATVASALASPPSAVDQYIEQLPTAEGPQLQTAVTPVVTPLPSATRERLHAKLGKDASPVERIASSSAYGAPTGNEHLEPQGTHVVAVAPSAYTLLGKLIVIGVVLAAAGALGRRRRQDIH